MRGLLSWKKKTIIFVTEDPFKNIHNSCLPCRHDSEAADEQRDILIFHCEFSSQRGPDFYMKLRERDRQLNKDVYPGLHFPECYLLHLGYKVSCSVV